MECLIEPIGSYGKYQYLMIALVGLTSALSSAVIFATIFTAAEPGIICKPKTFINSSFLIQNVSHNESDNCQIWSNLYSNNMHQNDQNISNNYECYFDKTYYGTTIITEWNLACDRQYLASLTQTMHILGSILGVFGGSIHFLSKNN